MCCLATAQSAFLTSGIALQMLKDLANRNDGQVVQFD